MTANDARYSRQILFSPIGAAGQAKIRQATVGLVGLGALGSAIAEQLVRAGIGKLIAVDRDYVEASNLHRQGLYLQSDAEARLPKAVAAGRRLKELNADVEVSAQVRDFHADCAEELFGACDLILDGTDGFEARYLINDFAVKHQIPWVYGACVAANGMTATIVPGLTPCLACLFPDPPPPGEQESCDRSGIIAPAANIVASLQVTEALKLIVGDLKSIRRGLFSLELWPFRAVELGAKNSAPRSDCRVCSERQFDYLEGQRGSQTVRLCGRDSVQISPRDPMEMDLKALADRLALEGEVRRNEFLIIFSNAEVEMTIFADGRALVKGLSDSREARRLYQRYVGT